MNILIVTPDYPDDRRAKYQFVKELVSAFARCGHRCYVISPYNILKNRSCAPYLRDESGVQVCRPKFLSLSTLRVADISLSYVLQKRALSKALLRMDFRPDVVYAHFWKAAEWVYDYARDHQLPLFVASGESEIAKMFDMTRLNKAFADYVSGVICVSNKNREESVALGLTTEEKCAVFPNAVDKSLFRKMDRSQCRKELGFPQDAYIVAFVGAFCERKGSKRLSSAIKMVKDRTVYSVFVGSGSEEPTCDHVLFKGTLPHMDIPKVLNASDVFVLPTLHEGCCNAVVEALACGLPVISSDLPFNWDILHADNALLVDPQCVEEIAAAISRLSDEGIRQRLAENALASVASLSIEARAEQILRFMDDRVGPLNASAV